MLCVICNTTKIYGNLSEVHLKRGALRKTFMTWKMKRSFFFVYVFCVHGFCLMHSPRLYAHHVTVKKNQPPRFGMDGCSVQNVRLGSKNQNTLKHENLRETCAYMHIQQNIRPSKQMAKKMTGIFSCSHRIRYYGQVFHTFMIWAGITHQFFRSTNFLQACKCLQCCNVIRLTQRHSNLYPPERLSRIVPQTTD